MGESMSRLKRWLIFCAMIGALRVPATAQVASAELSGTVLDSSGAAVANAKIAATNLGTNLVRNAASDNSGNYIITQLAPGDYSLAVEANGFRKLVQNGLTLQINQQAQVNLTLQL